MHPIQDEDGTWRVDDITGYTLASGLTNAQAWRFIDKAQGELVNGRESVADWVFRMQASRE